jgi:hypothetical protein
LDLTRRFRSSPLALVVAIALVSAVVRFAVALRVRTPIFYPDEYLYTALSRALGDGRFAEIRGGHVSLRTTAYLGPILMAPAWLLAGAGVAYRVCQAIGSIAFAASVFPAYGLARRLGISARGAVATALLAVVVPSGFYTSTLLSESYAYPIFLLAVFAAVEAIATPRVMFRLSALVLGLGLCVAGGLQFLYFVPVCIAAYLLARANSLRAYLMCSTIIVALSVYFIHEVQVRDIVHLDYSVEALAGALTSWFAVNLLVFAIGAGWVLVPGGFASLWSMIRTDDRRARAFAFLTILLVGATLLEATLWSASGQGVYERFAFYTAPLVVIALIWAVEYRALARWGVAVFAYTAALGAVLLPALPPLHGAGDEHAPALHALSNFAVGGRPASIIWAPALVALALLVAWRGATSPWNMINAGIAICIALSIGSSVAYVGDQPDAPVPSAHASNGSSLVTWSAANSFLLMRTLFWNPEISRVVVLSRPHSPDGLPVIAAHLGRGRRLKSADGSFVRGPFVFGLDTTPLGEGTQTGGQELTTLKSMPVAIAFGRYRQSGYLGVVGRLVAHANGPNSSLAVRLRSPNGTTKRITFVCDDGFRKDLDVGQTAVDAVIPLKAGVTQDCWFGITRGAIARVGHLDVSVESSIALVGSKASPTR